jgi:hypothetical protein
MRTRESHRMRREVLLALLLTACAARETSAPAPAVPESTPPGRVEPVVPAAKSAVQVAPPITTAPPKTRKKREPSAPTAATPAPAAAPKEPIAEQVLADGGPALKKVLASPQMYRFQVVYGEIENGKLVQYTYRPDAEYFFPASSMKVPITFATVARLAKMGITRDGTLRLFPVDGEGAAYTTTIAREISRALIVSDNFSANRLLAIGGHREIHEMLWGVGLKSARIRSGFATGDAIDPAEVSPKIEVVDPPKTIPPRKSDLALPPNDAKSMDIGKAQIVDGRRVDGPLSFASKNAMRLRELQDTLVRIMRPDLVGDASLAAADREYLQKTLGTLPSESGLAGYDRNVVADYQLDPFLRGIERVRPRGKFKVYSKVGQAFGFLIGNVYVVDVETQRAFFLTAAIFANPDEVMNDDLYAYDTIAFPALADVGEAFTRYAFD